MPLRLFLHCRKCRSLLRRLIKVEARIDPESRAVVEEATTRPLGHSQDGIGLGEREAGESRRQQIARFRRQLGHIFGALRVLREDHRQAIGLGRFVEGAVLRRVGKATFILLGAVGNLAPASLLKSSGQFGRR